VSNQRGNRRWQRASLSLGAALVLVGCYSPSGAPGPDASAPNTPETTPIPPGFLDPDPSGAYRVVPGQQVGPVTADTSRADLIAWYGAHVLEDAPIAMGEGTTAPGTMVYGGSDRQFAVVWQDASQTRPQLIKDFGRQWQTPEGLGVGTDYDTLQSALGTFQVYGFAWDYGGTVVLTDSRLAAYDGYLILRLAPSETALAQHPETYRAVMGDIPFASDNPNLNRLDLSVYEMVVYFTAPERLARQPAPGGVLPQQGEHGLAIEASGIQSATGAIHSLVGSNAVFGNGCLGQEPGQGIVLGLGVTTVAAAVVETVARGL
jgi:hypothetical protein